MKRREVKISRRNVSKNVSKKSPKPGDLKACETFPVLNSSDRNLRKSTTISSGGGKRTSMAENTRSNSRKSSLPKIPKDAAVHFGNFYGLEENASGKSGDEGQNRRNNANIDLKSSPKSEFTRQMVHKLERSAGTEEYARQVSALLEDTVEPANFRVNPLPSENSIPDGRQNPTGYPLWYKDPYKMPTTAKKEYRLLKEKYGNVSSKVRSQTPVEELSSSEEECDEDDEDDEEDEEDEEEEEFVEKNTNESSKNLSSDRSSSSSADESVDETSSSYESSDDEDDSFVSTEKEEENDNYETLDTVLHVQ